MHAVGEQIQAAALLYLAMLAGNDGVQEVRWARPLVNALPACNSTCSAPVLCCALAAPSLLCGLTATCVCMQMVPPNWHLALASLQAAAQHAARQPAAPSAAPAQHAGGRPAAVLHVGAVLLAECETLELTNQCMLVAHTRGCAVKLHFPLSPPLKRPCPVCSLPAALRHVAACRSTLPAWHATPALMMGRQLRQGRRGAPAAPTALSSAWAAATALSGKAGHWQAGQAAPLPHLAAQAGRASLIISAAQTSPAAQGAQVA